MDAVQIQKVLGSDSVKIFYNESNPPVENKYVIYWHLLNGGNPGANGDYIGLWKSDGQGNIDLGGFNSSTQLNNNVTDGSIIITPSIGLGEYVFGYTQCWKPPLTPSPLVSATLSIPAGEFDPSKVVISNTSMELLQQTDYSLAINLTYPQNFDAVTGTWIGIFKDSITPQNLKYKALCKKIMPSETAILSAAKLSLIINDFSLIRSTNYVIGYFVNGWDDDPGKIKLNALAAWLSFST
jgi:hypothetical protein